MAFLIDANPKAKNLLPEGSYGHNMTFNFRQFEKSNTWSDGLSTDVKGYWVPSRGIYDSTLRGAVGTEASAADAYFDQWDQTLANNASAKLVVPNYPKSFVKAHSMEVAATSTIGTANTFSSLGFSSNQSNVTGMRVDGKALNYTRNSGGTFEHYILVTDIENETTTENDTGFQSSSQMMHMCEIDTNKFAFMGFDGSGASKTIKVVVATLSGTTLTFGTPVTLAAADSSNDLPSYSNYYDSSGDHRRSAAMDKLDTDKFVVTYYDGGTDLNYAHVGSVSGSTITMGTKVQLTNTLQATSNLRKNYIIALDTTHFAVQYYNYTGVTNNNQFRVGSVSGTTITLGTPVQYTPNSGATDFQLQRMTSTSFLSLRGNEHVVSTVSGTTLTVGSSITTPSFNNGANFLTDIIEIPGSPGTFYHTYNGTEFSNTGTTLNFTTYGGNMTNVWGADSTYVWGTNTSGTFYKRDHTSGYTTQTSNNTFGSIADQTGYEYSAGQWASVGISSTNIYYSNYDEVICDVTVNSDTPITSQINFFNGKVLLDSSGGEKLYISVVNKSGYTTFFNFSNLQTIVS